MRRIQICLLLLLGLLQSVVGFSTEPERFFYVYNAANGLADNSAQTINCTKTGRLVITTMGQINFFDGQQFHYIDPTTENTYPLSKYKGHAHLYFDKHHHLWLKKRHSVTCVNLTKEMFVDNIIDEFRKMGMEDKVEDLFVDADNIAWFLTEKGIFSTGNKRFYKVDTMLNLQELGTYEDKYLLLFYENGRLDVLDMGSGSVVYSEKPYNDEMSQKYAGTTVIRELGSSFYQIRNGHECGILMRFDVNKRKWETILETPYYLSNIVEHDSILYIPSAYGYWTYELSSGQMEHIERLRMSNGQMLLTDINAMEFDRQGGLWVGTEKRGLLYARPYSSPFRVYGWTDKRAIELANILEQQAHLQFTYRDKPVNCVFHDSRGWDWVGTSTGLQIYRNKSANLPQLITRNDGLENNVIHSIVEDNSHNIWVGTSYGICCLVIKDEKVRYVIRYNQWDGLPAESFENGRSILLPDGSIAMQALDHVIEFNPTLMATLSEKTLFEIYPKLVRLYVNGSDVRTGDKLDGKVILEKALTRTKVLNLSYDHNSLSLTFSGLNYFRPQQTYYRVRVSGPGMENKWRVFSPFNSQGLVDRSGQLHLPLPSLAPGSYKIEVQSSMLPDEWTTTPYEWEVNINEPWWRTAGVFILLILLLFTLFVVYVYLYLKNANMRARRNSEEQGIIKRIRSFAGRCDPREGIILEPLRDEMMSAGHSTINDFSPEFMQMIQTIIPVVLNKNAKSLTMRGLSSVANMKLSEFYSQITLNIYKNPRQVAMQMMLKRAAELLKADKNRNIADISEECCFVSPNFFIASFYRKYHQTPEEFRRQ